jgi:hypothetical protein
MTLGLRESQTHRRRQRRSRLLKWLFLLSCVTTGGVALYQLGATLAEAEIGQLREETSRLSTAAVEVERRNLNLVASAEQAKSEALEWQRRYERDVPQGPAQHLYSLVTGQLAAGVTEDRLAFLIRSAGKSRACANTPVTKRFLIQTPISRDANHPMGSVSFADNAVTVIGEGQSALDAANRPQAWFDPAKPVTMLFSRLGGETSKATAKLPLHHSVVVGNHEYRFTVTAGDSRGFVNVTADRCAFP